MKVLHLAQGRKYTVWALCDDDETCQVMETLTKVRMEHPDLVETMLPLLLEVVPNDGPPLEDRRRAKMVYRNVLYELKADKYVARRQHFGLRVIFFLDGAVVVCAHAFCKSGGTPQESLDIALAGRARYFEEKGNLEFVT
jgi:hypothetical protein